jgi:hypothetical protein
MSKCVWSFQPHVQNDQFVYGCRYAMCSLYQNTLFLNRPLITDWAAAMLRSSRAALWNSVESIQNSLKQALEEKLILLLPLNM